MNIIRKFRGKFKESSHFNVNSSDKNVEHQNQTLKSVVGYYRPLDEKNHCRSQLTNTAGRYHSFDENFSTRKRTHDSNGDENHDPKRRRLNVPPRVQYGIKKSNQSMRKILEELFDPEITADGWEKKYNRIEYHTKIRGKCFYKLGGSVDEAKERVAEKALKELCNFKYETISWPEKLRSFQLNQEFADGIERMVRSKFDEIMKGDRKYKDHKVRSSIIMSTGTSLRDCKIVAIATGTKCICDVNSDDNGAVLHDMHAEVLARRCFLRFLYDQLEAMVDKKSSIFESDGKEIQLKEGLKFHLYINTVPCGDARIFSLKGCHILKNESKEGSLRTKRIGRTEPLDNVICLLRYPSKLRIKLLFLVFSYAMHSMSCSDKIARWNVLGLQGGSLVKFIQPIYLESIILGSFFSPSHMYRAITGRLENAISDLPAGYGLNKPKFNSTSIIETDNSSLCDYGVCWSKPDDGMAPEIINLNTGLTVNGHTSNVSKLSLKNMYKSINRKLSDKGSDKGTEKFNKVKKIFYTALKNENLGVWEKNSV